MTTPDEHWDTQDAAVLASCLRRDQQLCKAGLRPSPLALFLPRHATSPLADAISTHLADKDEDGEIPFVPKSVRNMWYTSVLQGLKDHLDKLDTIPSTSVDSTSSSLSRSDLEAAVKVLEYLRASQDTQVTGSSRVDDVLPILHAELSFRGQHQKPSQNFRPPADLRRCYICRFIIATPHPKYPALCDPCGSFSIAESSISLPQSLDLTSKAALVTGGRVNLGFHCALRLLRCGARTIVSTRYPLDAEARYRAEPDFHDWQDRFKIIGADFRTSKDAFNLVSTVKAVLRDWNECQDTAGKAQLFLLINNAAQTLTDSIESEAMAVRREESLRELLDVSGSQVAHRVGYKARIRGGVLGAIRESSDIELGQETDAKSKAVVQGKTSWAQSFSEIPYEDVVTAQSVNAFVPLILCRELLPMMGSDSYGTESPLENDGSALNTPLSEKPQGYIINVSSREGIFESRPNSRSKSGFHVHTNMSKAALNMLTETEAGQMWKTRRIAMNTVDPGYMSAAPDFRGATQECPIGFEDGAARVLWPIAVGETRGVAVWGRFLKHFGKVEVEVGLGR